MFRSKTFLYVCPSESLSSLLLSISLQWWRKSDLFLCFWLEVQSDIMLIAANLITTKYRPQSNIQFVVRKFTYFWWVDFVSDLLEKTVRYCVTICLVVTATVMYLVILTCQESEYCDSDTSISDARRPALCGTRSSSRRSRRWESDLLWRVLESIWVKRVRDGGW